MSARVSRDAPVAEGDLLAEKYEVQRVIGHGGMGVVVEAIHAELSQRVALKFLLREYVTQKEAAGRFLREARAASRIKSEHVARVSDVGRFEHGEPYMVMEFLDGQDLAKELSERGRLPIEDAVDFVIQACEAVGEAHSYGIVHRDLKPSNLFLTQRPDGSPLVKVLDFGISKMNEADELTRTAVAMGSALYMSPEQMESTRDVDPRTDIYALGISLYELIAGRTPFVADSLPQLVNMTMRGTFDGLRSLRPDVPVELESVVHQAFHVDREARPQTVADLVALLTPFAPTRSSEDIGRVMRLAASSNPSSRKRDSAATPVPNTDRASQPGQGATIRMEDPLALQAADTEVDGPSEVAAASANAKPSSRVGSLTDSSAVSLSQPPRSGPRRRWALLAVAGLGIIGAAAFFGLRQHTPASNGSNAVVERSHVEPEPDATAAANSPPAIPKPTAKDSSTAADAASAAPSATPTPSSTAASTEAVAPATPPTTVQPVPPPNSAPTSPPPSSGSDVWDRY